MPQMATLSWMSRMITLITMVMILNSLNYFSFLYKNKSFIVRIETISNMIRTLAIRLTANMIASHLLLTLLGNTAMKLSLVMNNPLIFTQLLFLILESAVAIIQSYVFSILSTLYSSKVS